MALRWYIVHAYSNFEHRVKSGLEERIERMGLQDKFGEILVPTEEVVEMREGAKRRSERKFFPGYVLVQMEMDDETWHLVKGSAEGARVYWWVERSTSADYRERKPTVSCSAFRKVSTSRGRRFCLSRARLFVSPMVRSTTSLEWLSRSITKRAEFRSAYRFWAGQHRLSWTSGK